MRMVAIEVVVIVEVIPEEAGGRMRVIFDDFIVVIQWWGRNK